MPLRPCLGYDGDTCTRIVRDGNRCPTHQRAYEQGRRSTPSARSRGYDAGHDRTRARLLPVAYGHPCPRCGEPMLPGQALDLGHTHARATTPGARGDRIEHARCNRSAGSTGDSHAMYVA